MTHVGRQALLELAEALVVGLLEGLEGAHEIVEGVASVVSSVSGFLYVYMLLVLRVNVLVLFCDF